MMAKDKIKFDKEKKDNITTKIMGSSSRYVSQPCKVNMVKKLERKSSENHNTDMMAREEQKFTWEEELDMLTRFHRANVGFKCLTIDNEHEHDNDKFLKNEESWIIKLDKPKAIGRGRKLKCLNNLDNSNNISSLIENTLGIAHRYPGNTAFSFSKTSRNLYSIISVRPQLIKKKQ